MTLATLMKKVVRGQEQQSTIAQLKQQYQQRHAEADEKRRQLAALVHRIETYLDRFEDRPQRGNAYKPIRAGIKMSDIDKQQVGNWEKEADKLRDDIANAETEAAKLSKQLASAQQQVNTETTDAKRLAEVQKHIEAKRADIAKLKQVIEQQPAPIDVGALNQLQKQLQAKRAALELGEAKQADIDALKRQYDEQKAAYEAQQSINSDTLAGLQQRLSEEQQALSQFEHHAQMLRTQTLRGMAQATAKDYLAAAEQVNQTLTRLLALQRLDSSVGVFVGQHPRFVLPALKPSTELELFEDGVRHSKQVDTTVEAIREDMSKQGIKI